MRGAKLLRLSSSFCEWHGRPRCTGRTKAFADAKAPCQSRSLSQVVDRKLSQIFPAIDRIGCNSAMTAILEMGAGARECCCARLDRVIGPRPVSTRMARAFSGIAAQGAARPAWHGVRGVGGDCLPVVARRGIHIRLLHPHRRRGTQRETCLSVGATPPDSGIRRITSRGKIEGARMI